jgi:tetratricopeptide (TPR) repeat protein
MAKNEIGEKIGAAWALHRQGDQDGAIAQFTALIRQEPNQIDAMYGLGLAQRSKGLKDAAVKTFEDCLALVNRALAENPGDDKYEILQRMVSQRLAELGVGTGK